MGLPFAVAEPSPKVHDSDAMGSEPGLDVLVNVQTRNWHEAVKLAIGGSGGGGGGPVPDGGTPSLTPASALWSGGKSAPTSDPSLSTTPWMRLPARTV